MQAGFYEGLAGGDAADDVLTEIALGTEGNNCSARCFAVAVLERENRGRTTVSG